MCVWSVGRPGRRRGPARALGCVLTTACTVAIAAGRLAGQQDGPVAPYPPFAWAEYYFYSYDQVAASAGLQPLRANPLPAGEREVRIWTQVEIGVPKSLHRFVERRGRVEGEWIYYWGAGAPDTAADERPGETMDDLLRYELAGMCDHFAVRQETATCRVRFQSRPDWRGALRRAGQAGLWDLPDPSTLTPDSVTVLDGWTMTVELRDGASYRAYRYNNPERHPKWPAAAQAVAVAAALSRIDSLAVPSKVVRVYRGRTSGRYQSAFRDCRGGPPVEFDGAALAEAKRAGIPVPDSVPVGPDLYVEVLADLSPEWLARQRHSRFPRLLQVVEVRRVERWSPGACRKR